MSDDVVINLFKQGQPDLAMRMFEHLKTRPTKFQKLFSSIPDIYDLGYIEQTRIISEYVALKHFDDNTFTSQEKLDRFKTIGFEHVYSEFQDAFDEETHKRWDALMSRSSPRIVNRSFKDIFDQNFTLVDKTDKSLWLKTTDVYPVFVELDESEYDIKRMMSQLGITSLRCRGPHGLCVYFQGLHWRHSSN